jgi:NitT/TauT family transport system substrate-binding protein
MARFAVVVVVLVSIVGLSAPAHAYELAISQYGQVTATLPWAVAMEKGYFADEGIKIDQIISGKGGGTTLRNMMASDLPYGEVATSAALAAIDAGLDIVIVDTASNHIGEIAMVVQPDSKIHDVRELAGKSVGFTNPKSTSEMLMRLALEKADLTGKVRMVATGGFGGGIALLQSGGIDATSIIDPVLTLKPKEFRVIFHFADLIPHMTWLVGVTTRKFATEQPELLRKLIRVRRRGVQYIYRNRQDAMQIYAKVWRQNPDAVATYFPKYFGYDGEWSQGGFEEQGLENMAKGLQLTGEAKGSVNWAAAIDQRFLPVDLLHANLAALAKQ